MTTLLIATRNAHKVGEIQAILGAPFRCLTLNEFPTAPKVVEDAPTFAGNAAKKALELAKWLVADSRSTHLPRHREATAGHALAAPKRSGGGSRIHFVLADDSGLEVDALNGAPGVHSARFAGSADGSSAIPIGNAPDADNNAKLLRLLQGVPLEKRTGRFRCVIALVPVPELGIESASPVCYADEFVAQTYDGACEGRIQLAPRGHGGFGYDPLFVPEGYTESFAQLGEDVKNQLSHRSKALAKVKNFFA